MNIGELLQNGDSVLMVKASELREFANYLLGEYANMSKREEESYKGTEEVCEMLQVSRGTLWRWEKSGYLSPVCVGGKKLYRMSDIESKLRRC